MMGIIDYGMGNLGSVRNACRFLGLPARVLTAPGDMEPCNALILPGVGAFGDCMEHLRRHGFVEPLCAWVAEDRPFLGICLGLQVLYGGSEESPGVPGLGLLPGRVMRFRLPAQYKIPQIGWNRVRQRKQAPLFEGLPDQSFFYFVHSYYVDTPEVETVAGTTEYGVEYTCAVQRGNLMAVQFHPEKSQQVGLRMLRNFGTRVQGEVPPA